MPMSTINEHINKRGRPRLDSEMVRARIVRHDLDSLDEWRSAQPDAPERPEAIRRLIRESLKNAKVEKSTDGDQGFCIQFGEDWLWCSSSPKVVPIARAPRDGSWFLAYALKNIDSGLIGNTGPYSFCHFDKELNGFREMGDRLTADILDISHCSPFPMPIPECDGMILDSSENRLIAREEIYDDEYHERRMWD